MGVHTTDELATKVQRIILLSIAISLIVILQGIVTARLRSKTGNSRVASDSAMVKVMYGLSLPFCGYLGARLRSSTLLGCFTGCNICGIVLFIVTTIILVNGVRNLDGTYSLFLLSRARVAGRFIRRHRHRANTAFILPENELN